MIGFETLLFGLIVGKYPVSLVVSSDVAAVELRLDGRAVGALTGPPWVLPCDFGPDLHPHELTAVAFDRDHREIARASRRVNVPHPEAEVQLLLERSPSRIVAAHLTWDNAGRAERPKVHVTLDGRTLAAKKNNPNSFAVPSYDPEQAHVLTAEVEFSGNRRARADAAFGGSLGDEVRTELTALPVVPDPGATLLYAKELQGFFAEKGTPVPVVAVEETPGRVALVLDQGVRERLHNSPWAEDRAILLGDSHYKGGFWGSPLRSKESNVGEFRSAKPEADSLDLLFSVSGPTPGHQGEVRHLFPVHRGFAFEPPYLGAQLHSLVFPSEPGDQQSLANAVAVAGVDVAARNACRAVVLLISGRAAADTSTLSVRAVLAFLADLRVPFEVWTMSSNNEDASLATLWGPAERVSTPQMLARCLERLRDRLHSQRIVWLDGAHLPQSIQLTDKAQGIKLAM